MGTTVLNFTSFPVALGTQEFEKHSTHPRSCCFLPRRTWTAFCLPLWTGTPLLDCILPSLSYIPSARWFPASRQTCCLSPLHFASSEVFRHSHCWLRGSSGFLSLRKAGVHSRNPREGQTHHKAASQGPGGHLDLLHSDCCSAVMGYLTEAMQ